MKRTRMLVALLGLCCWLLVGCSATAQPVTTTTLIDPTTSATTEAATTTSSFTTESFAETSESVSKTQQTRTEKSKTGKVTTTATTVTATVAVTTGATTKTVVTTVSTKTSTTPATVKPSDGELRGAWVSYIELNALLSKCKTAEQGRSAIDGLMDRLVASGMNAVFFHVRANSDAYYSSSLFKTASAVKKLIQNGFDPLEYAVQSAHQRNMQLHAWINPYRIGKDSTYIVNGAPTFQDGNGRYYYVPTSAAAQRVILDGIRELLNTYAIDGIQYDDYFYPTDLLGEETVYSFESADYASYTSQGGTLSIGDWRRAGVDALVAGTHALTKAKDVVFGISPGHNAYRNYNGMFANTQKWLAQEGYIDYLCPQIYFGFEHSSSSFDKVTDTWLGYERHSSVKLYVGIAVYKIGLGSDTYAGNGKYEWRNNSDIMKRSVLYLRQKGISGIGFYSSTFFDPELALDIFKTDNDLTVARKEIENLVSIL